MPIQVLALQALAEERSRHTRSRLLNLHSFGNLKILRAAAVLVDGCVSVFAQKHVREGF